MTSINPATLGGAIAFIAVAAGTFLHKFSNRRSRAQSSPTAGDAMVQLSMMKSMNVTEAIAVMAMQMSDQQAQITDLRQQLQAGLLVAENAEMELSNLDAQVKSLRQALVEAQTRNAEAQIQLQSAQTQIGRLRARVAVLESKLRGAGLEVPADAD